ncbi:MAG: hypothetical protein LBC20_15670, partial [Planctomycetaceae bacterium]|nr:hypothetical protein [Planctomycetaceae bacterium]
MNTTVCQRLYEKLVIQGGKRQFVLTGCVTDMFFADTVRGLCRNIEDALLYYAVRQGYEIAFAIDDKMSLRFATSEMQTKYQNIIDKKSEDPQKKQGSVKRGNRNTTPVTSTSPTSPNSENQPNTVTATQLVQNNTQGKSQQIFDGILNRLLPHHTKSFVILSFAERILEYGQNGTLTAIAEQKLKTVREWAKIEFGNSHSCSVLIVDDSHHEEFERLSDLCVAGLEHRTNCITVGTPNVAEIREMLIRIRNR